MHTLRVETEIAAPASVVYDVLTHFDAYPEWNGFTRIEGVAAPGERLAVRPGPDAGSAPTFRPVVQQADGSELRWIGHLGIAGLFDGEHRFRVESVADDRSVLVQDERFTGVLSGLLFRLYGDDWRANFTAVNEALKAHVESLPSGMTDDRADAPPT